MNRRWFTLYFIPVIPLGSSGEHVQCLSCGSQYDPQVLAGAQATDPFVVNAQDKPGATVPLAAFAPTAPAPTSALAIASLVFALVSPVAVCLCGLSLLTSLVAIVTGHISLARIKGSAGQLAGRGMAMTGVIIGYVMLAVSLLAIAAFLPGIRGGWRHAGQDQAAVDQSTSLDAANRLFAAEVHVVTSSTDGSATGNSPTAKALAEDYAASIKEMRNLLFTADEDSIVSLTKGEFVTHCELNEGRCAFIVHVPAYRKFDDDAKDALAEIAWSVAQETVDSTLEPGDQLAVGLRGSMMYGAVLIGRVARDDQKQDVFEQCERDDLLAFFPPPAYATPYDVPADDVPADDGLADDGLADDGLADMALPTEVFRPEAESETSDDFAPQTRDEIEASTEDPASSAPIPTYQAPITRKLVMGPVFPGVPVPDHAMGPWPSHGPVSQWPSSQQPSAPRGDPKPESSVVVSREIVREFPAMGWSIESLAFAPHGRWLAAGKLDRSLLILDVQTGATLSSEEKLDELGQVLQVAFSADEQFVVAAGYSGAVVAWSIDSAGVLTDPRSLTRHAARVQSLAISPTAPFLITGAADGELTWQSYVGATSKSRRQKALAREALAVHLPREGLEAMATDGSSLVRLDLKTAELVQTRQIQRSSARAAAFSSDGRKLAVSTGYEIQVWDTATGQSLLTFQADHEIQWSVAFLPDGNRLVSGGRGQATLWDIQDGQAISRFDLGGILYIKAIAISPDGTLLAAIPASAGQTLTVLRIPE